MATAIEVDEAGAELRRSPRRVSGDEAGEGFIFPFACVSEHTRFTEATETNRVR